MTVRKLVPMLSLALLVGSGTAQPASAEWFVDLYGGGAFYRLGSPYGDFTAVSTAALRTRLPSGGVQ